MNDRIKIKETQLLSDSWYVLNKVTFDYLRKDNTWETQIREVYDRGNGATILLYNTERKTVILTRQFRIPTYLNGNTDGMLIEACAGLLEKENPEDCIRRETEEETGYVLKDVRKVFESYMSPGSVTEILYFFVAEYSKDMKISDGGGLKKEQEEIEVLEVSLDEALAMIDTGAIKDGKTIMLLQYARLKNIL
ncbi:GDP-mannose pyrophosphatase NudK [Flavobacterium kingsejongi]|uniref:GDP-mannose pyrophosphatase n=1 Tax=Flavobacterium kingsejongi TaxID=1678728 RepID=A0A2S1LRK2_9FLAO|nr:GDP-mannose pyrophosphatase NudK [Flavobacterium kingsejongi]AWG26292.1 GDP-mannose pyrophosphatase NudK [Flavobacterium kingsejongi]